MRRTVGHRLVYMVYKTAAYVHLTPKIPQHVHLKTVCICFYTTFTNFSTKYLVMCKVYTDVGGIN